MSCGSGSPVGRDCGRPLVAPGPLDGAPDPPAVAARAASRAALAASCRSVMRIRGSELDRDLGDGSHRGLVDLRADAQLLLDLLLDLVGQVRVVLEELPGVLLALPQLVAVVGVPGAGL